MGRRLKVGRNDPCPCGQGESYKKCCEPTTDWNNIIKEGESWIPHLSIRGRNSLFAKKLAEALQLDSIQSIKNMKDYKSAFTANAVEDIHRAVMDVWPADTDISKALAKQSSEVSSLYVGDYGIDHLKKGLVRHSTYSEKILVIDPFLYPASVEDEYNPILNPEKYRSQSLKNANLWFSLLPWIDEGLVEIIRTPADFDRKLMWNSLLEQEKKFQNNVELQKAREISVKETHERHAEEFHLQHMVLSASKEHLEQMYSDSGLKEKGYTVEEFLDHIQRQRDENPDFLGSLDDNVEGQMHMYSTGTSYNIALLTATLSNSFIVTDVYSKWKEIEIDRENSNAASEVWSPFAKAFHDLELKYLDKLNLDHALVLRKENLLGSMRVFLNGVWKNARTTDDYSEANVRLLSDELQEEVQKADQEWRGINRNIVHWLGTETAAGLLATGPLVATGYGAFLGAAIATISATTIAVAVDAKKAYKKKFPAAFFLRV